MVDRETNPIPLDVLPWAATWQGKVLAGQSMPCRKLSPRFIGPYKIVKQINSVSYKLLLPPHMRVSPVFHVSLLWPADSGGIANLLPPGPVEIESLIYNLVNFPLTPCPDCAKRGETWSLSSPLHLLFLSVCSEWHVKSSPSFSNYTAKRIVAIRFAGINQFDN